MGKCFSCVKSTSTSNSTVNNLPKGCVQEDITSTKEEVQNTLMFSNSSRPCSVPHLQTVLFKRNDDSTTTNASDDCGNQSSGRDAYGKKPKFNNNNNNGRSRVFYPKITNVIKTNTVVDEKTNVGASKSIASITSHSKIIALYDRYKDPIEENYILAEGIEKLCSDLDLLPEEFKVLLLAWQFNACQMCQFDRNEFVNGCKRMNVDSVNGIREKLFEINRELETDKELFKQLYRYTFDFGLDNNVGQRILPVDIAASLWKLVYTVHAPAILPLWLNFLIESPHIRGIPRDTWNMFLNFSEYVGNNLSSYDDSEAWPSIFDEFVESENDKKDVPSYG